MKHEVRDEIRRFDRRQGFIDGWFKAKQAVTDKIIDAAKKSADDGQHSAMMALIDVSKEIMLRIEIPKEPDEPAGAQRDP